MFLQPFQLSFVRPLQALEADTIVLHLSSACCKIVYIKSFLICHENYRMLTCLFTEENGHQEFNHADDLQILEDDDDQEVRFCPQGLLVSSHLSRIFF